MRILTLTIAILGLIGALSAQNPPERPEILWMIGAPNVYGLYSFQVSVTDDQNYILVTDGTTQQVYRTQWLLQNRTTALVTFSQDRWGAFSSPSESNQEYVWYNPGSSVSVHRFVRRSNTHGDAYIENQAYPVTNLSNVHAILPLRNNSDRSLNRLAVAGRFGELVLIRLNETGNQNNPITFDRVSVSAHAGVVNHAVYDPETQRIVSCGEDGLIRVWRVETTPNLALTHVKTIANGWGSVTGVGLINSAQGVLLVSASQFGIVTARLWNGGNPSITPLWQSTVDRGFFDRGSNFYEELYLQIYGAYRGLLMIGARGSAYLDGYLLDPLTGRTVYETRRTGIRDRGNTLWAHQIGFHLRQGGAQYIPRLNYEVHLADYGQRVPGHLGSLRSAPIVSGIDAAVTAIEATRQPVNPPSYRLTAGFSNGVIRNYTGTLSFNQSAQNTSTFANQRIVRLKRIGNDLFAFGSDGAVHRLDPNTLSSTASVDAQQEIMDADAIVSGNTVRVAVIGQTATGVPQVRVYTYSNGVFSAPQDFNPGGVLAQGVRFAPNTPDTLITLSQGALRRYNFSNNAWTQQWTFNRPSTGLEVNSASEILLTSDNAFTPEIRDLAGNLIQSSLSDSARRVSSLASAAYVWGISQFAAAGDIEHGLAVGARDCGVSIDLLARVSDEPLCIASFPDEDLYFAGCADGSIWQVVLPMPQTLRLHDYGRTASQFGIDSVLRTIVLNIPSARAPVSGNCNRFEIRFMDLQNGSTLQSVSLTPFDEDLFVSTTSEFQNQWWRVVENTVTVHQGQTVQSWSVSPTRDFDNSRSPNLGFATSNVSTTYNNQTVHIPRVSILTPGNSTPVTFDAWFDSSANQPIHGRTNPTSYLADVAANVDASRVAIRASAYLNGNNCVSIWRRGQNNVWTFERVLLRGQDWGNFEATMIDFHPTRPNLLYVGFSNGSIAQYNLDTGVRIRYYVPSRPVGSVGAMDIGEFLIGDKLYTVMAFTGDQGMSIWVDDICRDGCFVETAFYNIDVGQSGGSLSLSQLSNGDVLAAYGDYTKHVVAKVATPLPSYCPEDVNNDGVVDDADLLLALFDFGATGRLPGDVNCDGLVDDADLLKILFRFGETCNRCPAN